MSMVTAVSQADTTTSIAVVIVIVMNYNNDGNSDVPWVNVSILISSHVLVLCVIRA